MQETATYISTPARTIYALASFAINTFFPTSGASPFAGDDLLLCAVFGGLISGEHGIGFGKKGYLAEFAGPVNMRLMRGIKETFDPKMILNPGKICYDPKEEA